MGMPMMPPRLPPVFMTPLTAMVSPPPTFMAPAQNAPSLSSTAPKQHARPTTAQYGFDAPTDASSNTAVKGSEHSGTSLNPQRSPKRRHSAFVMRPPTPAPSAAARGGAAASRPLASTEKLRSCTRYRKTQFDSK